MAAKATAYSCVALGAGSECDEEETVSIGTAGNERRIVNTAAGQADTDAANMAQLRANAQALGGGATFNAAGQFIAPTYIFQSGAVYNDVGSALYDLDARVYKLEQNPGGGGQGPAGPAGADGASAYQIAVNNGFTGTETEWLESLRGADGRDGASAYQVAVNNGFTGTETEWLASLKGDKGERGDVGPQGPAGANGSGENRYFVANGDDDGTDNARADKLGGVAAGRKAAAMGFSNVAIGEDALAESGEDGMGAVAIGPYSHANGASTTAVGDRAYAEGNGSTALGTQTIARDNSLAAGTAAKATGHVSTAVGPTAQATGRAGTALGNNARAQADYATAIGSATVAQQNGTTVGTYSAAGVNAAALGYNAQATHTNSVAIGANTRTTGSNQVAMGYRQVTQVANGRIERGSTDAVNGGQMWDLERRMDDRWQETNRQIERVGAQSAALSMMNGAATYLPVGKVAFNAGWGQYGSQSAFAVGAKARLSERSSIAIGFSYSGGKAMGGVGYSLIID